MLSRVSYIPKGRCVFHGVGGVKLTDEFVTEKEVGGRGGVDFGECLLVLEYFHSRINVDQSSRLFNLKSFQLQMYYYVTR